MTAAAWQALMQRLLDAAPDLSPLAAGIVAARALGITADSRGFARDFDIAHALVLRECQALDQAGLLTATARDDRVPRLFLDLTAQGRALVDQCAGPGSQPVR